MRAGSDQEPNTKLILEIYRESKNWLENFPVKQEAGCAGASWVWRLCIAGAACAFMMIGSSSL
jgi:hypothetical protein